MLEYFRVIYGACTVLSSVTSRAKQYLHFTEFVYGMCLRETWKL